MVVVEVMMIITFVTTKRNRIVPEDNDNKEYNRYCSHGI